MKVVRAGDTPEAPATSPLFIGAVHSRPLVTHADSAAVSVTHVRFTFGGKNKFHTHTADQILYVTEGRGIVATREEEAHIGAGDIVHVPAGEVHWHGAEPGQSMSHLSILPPSTTQIIDD